MQLTVNDPSAFGGTRICVGRNRKAAQTRKVLSMPNQTPVHLQCGQTQMESSAFLSEMHTNTSTKGTEVSGFLYSALCSLLVQRQHPKNIYRNLTSNVKNHTSVPLVWEVATADTSPPTGCSVVREIIMIILNQLFCLWITWGSHCSPFLHLSKFCFPHEIHVKRWANEQETLRVIYRL